MGKRLKSAMVIVVCDRHERLRKLLGLLKAQKRRPDCIIIVNNGVEGVGWAEEGFGSDFKVETIKTGGVGPAGGFKEGAKKAYAEGYDYVILADDDAYPADENLISCLLEDAEKGMPIVGGYYTDGCIGGSANHYFTIHRSVFSKAGFHFKPFFLMGEDIELQFRMAKAADVFFDKRALIDHPWRITTDSPRSYYSVRNSLVAKAIYGGLASFLSVFYAQLIRAGFVALFLRKPAFLKAFIDAYSDFLGLKMGRRDMPPDKLDIKKIDPADAAGKGRALFVAPSLEDVEPPAGMDVERSARFNEVYHDTSPIGIAKSIIWIMRRIGGRDIVLASRFMLSWPPFSLMTRDIYWYDVNSRETYLVYKNSPILSALFLVALAPIMTLVLPFASLSFLLKRGAYKKMLENEVAEDMAFCKKADGGMV